MGEEIVLSILIPNRHSEPFIFETIENLLSCKNQKFEIIVSDNSFPLKLDFSKYKDSRIKVFIEPQMLSMTQNFYNALKRAKGKYITYIGSDDGCIPENLSNLIDYLDTSDENAINTRHTFFNNDKNNYFVTVPRNPVTFKQIMYRYPNYLSLYFYSYRTWLPMPYALAAVKRELLFEIINNYDQIPGIAPDDFLGHFIAQKIKRGIFFDLPVFITGNSIRSNASALLLDQNTENSNQFISDSQPKLGQLTKIFGLNCLPSIAIEHYFLAKKLLRIKSFTLMKYWVVFSCNDYRHHKGQVFKLTLNIRRIIISALDKSIKFLWKLLVFWPLSPSKPIKIKFKNIDDISTAAILINAYTKYVRDRN